MVSVQEKSQEADVDIPRIKYHVAQSGRAFERLLKEHSFTELHDAIRAKLDLDSSSYLQMYRVQDGVKYDLEDEDDFAAMKSAAYASDAFDVHVAYQKRKISKTPYKRPSRSRRVSIVLPEKDADSVQATIQQSSRPTGSEEEEGESTAEAPAPPKKSRQNPKSTADSQPSILKKRKVSSDDTNEDVSEDTSEPKEPPTKKQKPVKPSKKDDDSAKAVKRKSSSDKLEKTVSQTEPSELPDTTKKAKTKPVETQEDADDDDDDHPPSKKTKTKHDGEAKSTTKPVSKVKKPATKTAKSSEDPLPSNLSYAELQNRIKSRRNAEENAPAVEKNSKAKTKISKEFVDSSSSPEPPQVNGEANDNGKKKASKEDDASSKKTTSKDSAKDQTKGKETPADATKEKAKDKKSDKKATVTKPSSKVAADSATTSKGSAKSTDASSNKQPKTIETLVAEIETSLKNPISKNGKNSILQASTAQAGPRRESTGSKSKVSQVVEQSSDEESESESESESSSSSSNSNSDGEDVVPNRKSTLAKTSLPVESESTRQSTNLDNVDVDALVRGPSAKKALVASLSKLEEEEGRGDEEEREESEVLEEEEEEVETRHSMIFEAARRLSNAKRRVVEDEDDDDDDDEDESNASDSASPPPTTKVPPEEEVAQKKTNDKGVDEDSASKLATPTPDDDSVTENSPAESEPDVSAKQPDEPPVPNQTETEPSSNTNKPLDESLEHPADEIEVPADERPTTPPPDDSRPHTPPPAPVTPKKSPATAIQATPKTPRTIQRMKDKKGNLPAEDGASAKGNDDDDDNTDNESVQATVRPARVMVTRARPAPRAAVVESSPPPPSPPPAKKASKSRAPSKPPPLVPVLEKRVLRSSRMPPPGIPAKSIKLRETTTTTKKKKNAKGSESEQEKAKDATAANDANDDDQDGTEQSGEAVLGSQWQVLQPSQPMTVTSPSQIDELQSVGTTNHHHHILQDGLKSPDMSSTRSGSRRRDENLVENLVGSTEVFIPDPDRPRSPLFLPGASQMSPSQFRFDLDVLGLDDGPPSSLQATSAQAQAQAAAPPPSHSEAESEPETDKELAMPTLSQPLKSIFPSLSELSFNKFRPSFLMKNQSQSQPQQQSRAASKSATANADDSDTEDSDDDDDSSSESDKGSHIPKNKRAGVGVVKKVKSRGLLR